ncbi:type II toxin-antitoxin system VapC family toxin [Gulosibacter molinativorax]|uniref:Ribonuclease VapC n=1 Tax=Gulosibacter molinativorax TaxID=256821 RepID=A0ABT7C6T3_9MICO|nr:type II toxin-antitoxin system VapC family toxin [Gulosibacter molinativorax]MDJ1370484.1 type II toxin-antitoxin system VapC family toxin [Gulosibacter molinativorax]QUY62106.1 Ribonuclease VapC [Gulosibacter molinativorax]
MIILDTNVVSELFRSQPNATVIGWLESLTDDVAITTITLAELLAGVHQLPEGRRRTELMSAIEGAIEPYRHTKSLLAFDEDAARAYADVVTRRNSIGRPISMADAQIAAICRVHGAVCATRNVKDFLETGIELFDPWGGNSSRGATLGLTHL